MRPVIFDSSAVYGKLCVILTEFPLVIHEMEMTMTLDRGKTIRCFSLSDKTLKVGIVYGILTSI